ncbi:MAG: sulfite exporter TauE/SafE family protein [Clostridia bacterium]|nr:sulfite exporter TauE/SafE family protein [Clostridia bacterium]MDD4146348.1 sulfite exporter TauE/SafE family protein [Clostridia bacterium]MDD4665522.1 sulfite exporter TauE/SafE family protein [Clostridia bacterium]
MQLNYKAMAILSLIGIFTGLINGLLGIGGGTILIPAMVFLLGEKQHLAHGTSLSIILPTAIVSTFVYQANNHLDWGIALKIALSGMIGGYLGARLMPYIPAPYLRKLFGVFMAVAGIRMIF